MALCNATKNDGTPCKNRPMRGRSRCYSHAGTAELSHRIENFFINNKRVSVIVTIIAILGLPQFFWTVYHDWDNARHSRMAGYLTSEQRGDWQVVVLGGGLRSRFAHPMVSSCGTETGRYFQPGKNGCDTGSSSTGAGYSPPGE